jgi:ABC-2 type transport system ATP-binding protein
MISVSHVTKRYAAVTALEDLSLEIAPGELFGLLGPNGAGKTTLMSLLVGHRNADGGEIAIGGVRISPDNLEMRKAIGYVPQQIALYDELSAQENLHIFGSFYSLTGSLLRERIDEAMTAVQLLERRKNKVKEYSGGMKRRLNLAAALLHHPSVLLCDEPTVGVDPQSRNAIFDFLRKLNAAGMTIVYTTHYMEEVERLCSRIGIIDHGKLIAEGTLNELLRLLPYEESITIRKNDTTTAQRAAFEQFGTLTADNGSFELKPRKGIKMSDVIAAIENAGIEYADIEWHKPTLEALFLQQTGRSMRD